MITKFFKSLATEIVLFLVEFIEVKSDRNNFENTVTDYENLITSLNESRLTDEEKSALLYKELIRITAARNRLRK